MACRFGNLANGGFDGYFIVNVILDLIYNAIVKNFT
jgi:hypothetical protein